MKFSFQFEVPENDDAWLNQKLKSAVRTSMINLYDIDSVEVHLTRKIARVLFMTLEYEAMHVERLLYILVQRAGSGTPPPTTFITPWSSLAEDWNTSPASRSKTATLRPAIVRLGHGDNEADDNDNISLVEGH